MKKALPYIIGGLLLLVLAGLLAGGNGNRFDKRVTLNKKDKIPYGTFVAFNNLPYLFPHANITINKKAPGYWEEDVLRYDTSHQSLLIVTKEFNASDEELQDLFHFVSRGNNVFISAYDLNLKAQDFFHFTLGYADTGFPMEYDAGTMDTLRLWMMNPPFSKTTNRYAYPGRKFYSHFISFDSTMSYVLERTADSNVVLLRIRAGEGSFYIHTAPLSFSNYFLLHRQNMGHYNQLLSVLDAGSTTVAWDEYYIHKPVYTPDKSPSPLRIFMQQPALRMALLTALAGLIIFVLLGLKRKQRLIPVIEPLRNDSLDFVKTIGRLYFQKKNNKNLCNKMIVHFTEYVHSHYKMNTGNMDSDFIIRLSGKSGSDEKTVKAIAEYISFCHDAPAIHDQQVTELYTLLEKFYKTS
ncbi:MAG: hypothetical protein JST63_02155 [Bacteroidetes bacterium]|nr:hypothetical protein [Bacteroidota bacterium]